MCHLILFLPVIALPVFWLLPLVLALPIYIVVSLFSAFIYYLAIMAMRKPVVTGKEAMIHGVGTIISAGPHGFRVRINSELWDAESDQPLQVGDQVEVVDVHELHLRVAFLEHGPDMNYL